MPYVEHVAASVTLTSVYVLHAVAAIACNQSSMLLNVTLDM